MKHASFVAAALLLAFVSAGCSLAGLDRADLPVCNTDSDCAALTATLRDHTCQTYACVYETGDCELTTVDMDGDDDPPVACGGGDCDDQNAAVHRGATEICNGVDDDCNGLFDGPDEDDDRDGHFDVCAGPAVTDDCDDTDPYTYLGAPELCDGIDDDCVENGVERQSGGRHLAPSEDVDDDAHAATDATCVAGDPGPPRVFPRDDCDDHDARTYLGAFEHCDGRDNDCDGTLDDSATRPSAGAACLPTALVAGGRNTCVRDVDDALVCWGDNGNGQLGDPSATADAALVVASGDTLHGVSLGGAGACGIDLGGDVWCWGSSLLVEHVLSVNFRSVPRTHVPTVTNATQVSVGGSVACAVLADHTVTCWGFACGGITLDGAVSDCSYSLLAVPVPMVADAAEVHVGTSLVCARTNGGAVWCWGLNHVGQLGIGGTGPGPGPVMGITDAAALGVGAGHVCVLRASGEVACWGANDSRQTGCAGCGSVATAPNRVDGIDATVAQLAVGGAHACVRYTDGGLACWGEDANGQLMIGDGVLVDHVAAVRSPTTGVRFVSAADAHTCVLRDDGVTCAGAGANYRLGDGRATHGAPPLAEWVPNRASVIAHAMQMDGTTTASCFRMPDLAVRCTGEDDFGEIDHAGTSFTATHAFGASDVVDLAMGVEHTCVVRSGGTVSCYGQTRQAQVPMLDPSGAVMGLSDAVHIAAGDFHTCAVRRGGGVVCWGNAVSGHLGDGGMASDSCMGFQPCSRTPLPVVGLDHAVGLAAGREHTCALRSDGSVSCWGANAHGATGTTPLGSTVLATPVAGLPSPAVAIAAADETTCALLSDASVWCWGSELVGSSFSVDPEPLVGVANAAQLAMTSNSLCIRQRSGTVRCLGQNNVGQLGNGTTILSSTLQSVLGLTDAAVLDCGVDHCCATRTSGQSVCWGNNTRGQLGIGDTTSGHTRPISTAWMLYGP